MILVIGATGFVGMYTVDRLLSDGKEVVATGRNKKLGEKLSNMGASFIPLDITDPEEFDVLPADGVDGIILLAGLLPANATADLETEDNAADYFKVNVVGLINVLEWARKHGINKVISTCSYSDVSGAWGKGYPITEEEPRDFKFTGDHAVYVISKNAANDVMEYYNQQHGMQCSCFRFPPVYGVGPHGTIMVNGKPYKSGIQTFIEKAEAGENIELSIKGRHDPVVVPRAVVVVEAMAALTVMDMLLVSMSSRLDMIQLFFQVENVEGTDIEEN